MKYNILILCTESFGGTKTFLFNQAIYLKNLGINVDLYCNRLLKVGKDFQSKKIIFKKFDNLLKSKKLEKISYSFIKNKGKKIVLITNPFLLITQFSFINNLKRKKIDIILSLHSGILEVSFFRIIGGFIFSFLIFDKINLIYGSNNAKKYWEKYFPWMKMKQSRVVLNGISLKKLHKKNIKKFTVGFVGRYVNEKNPILFAETAKYSFNYKMKYNFKMFGYGNLYSTLKANYKKYVEIFKWTKEIYIYKNINILLITSPVENYPYTALEAKSYGVPIVYTSNGDIKKIIKNSKEGIYCASNDPKDILDHIKTIEKKYSFFVKNCTKNIKKFKLETSCKLFWKNHIHVKYNNR